MADEPRSLLDLIARFIRQELQHGRMDSLLAANEALLDPHAGSGGFLKLAANALIAPTMQAEAAMPVPEVVLIPDEVVERVRSASPKLANEIQIRSPQDATLLITLFMALVQLIQTGLTVYQILHSQPPTPPQIVEIFNQTYNVVNQTTVVNPPPPTRAG